jgi:hypothetical protein
MTDETATSEQKSDGRFKSGNPGRPRGVRNRATALAERLASKDIGEIVAVLVEAAKAGDVPSATLLLNRLWPAPKGRLVAFELPAIKTPPLTARRL